MIKKIFKWIFSSELEQLEKKEIEFSQELFKAKKIIEDGEIQYNKINSILKNIDVSIDVHESQYSPSWAVISLQGDKTDYLKFMNLGSAEISHIASFLRQFERDTHIKIDASPQATKFLKINRER